MEYPATLAFIFPSDTFGGHEMMSLKMIRLLREQKADVHCYVSRRNKQLIEKLAQAGVPVRLAGFYNSKLDHVFGYFNPWILANIYQLRLAKGPLVLVNGTAILNHATTLAAAFHAWLYGIRCSMYIPMLHTARELDLNPVKTHFYDASVRRALKSMSDIWTIDGVWSDRVMKVCSMCKTYVIRNFVEPAFPKAKRIPESDQAVALCFVGRIEKKHKGLDFLMGILQNINTGKEILMHIVGDGSDLDWLKNETLNARFRSRISFRFHGWISNPLQIVSSCDALIISSRVEGVPLVVIESLMVGTPVFAFSIPGITGLVGNEFLASPFLVEEFAEKLNAFLQNREGFRASRDLAEFSDASRFERELNCAVSGVLQA